MEHYKHQVISLRFLSLSQKEIEELKARDSKLKIEIGKKSETGTVVCIDLVAGMDFRPIITFIQDHQFPQNSFGIFITVETDNDHDWLSLPQEVLDFYRVVGGTIDFSVIFVGDYA
jgi:hypothetical protein